MINCFETYFDSYFAYFAAEPHQFLKKRVQLENLVFVVMSTRENTRLIIRASLKLFHTYVNQYKTTIEHA